MHEKHPPCYQCIEFDGCMEYHQDKCGRFKPAPAVLRFRPFEPGNMPVEGQMIVLRDERGRLDLTIFTRVPPWACGWCPVEVEE